MQSINEIEELIKLISKLPGLGPKSAKRIVLKLINNRDELIKPMASTPRLDAATSGIGKFREAYDQWIEEGFKKFPSAKVQDKAAEKPDTAKGESQARKMDRARTAHTDKRTKDDAKSAVKERELDNRKTGL